MSINPNFYPTEQQNAAYSHGVAYVRNAIDCGFAEARKLHDALVELGTENEDGEKVRHGANLTIIRTRDAIVHSIQYLQYVDRDYYDLARYRAKYVNNRFVSDEVFERDFAYIKDEIIRLENIIANYAQN